MKIHVLSKDRFDNLLSRNNITIDNIENITTCFFISINDTCDKSHLEDRDNLKVLYFDDIFEDLIVPDIGTSRTIKCKAMTKEQAEELFKFIKKHKDKPACIVHCAAGVSRSGAVGQFICDYTRSSYYEFKKDNPYIFPNPLVLDLLREQEKLNENE